MASVINPLYVFSLQVNGELRWPKDHHALDGKNGLSESHRVPASPGFAPLHIDAREELRAASFEFP